MVFSTGKLANLANGACLVRLGDTIVLVAACSGAPREGTDFFPLQVDYREKYSAAGKFPGGYIKREGRPSTKEILTCRMCFGGTLWSKVTSLVYGAPGEFARQAGFDEGDKVPDWQRALENRGIKVRGPLEEEAAREPFELYRSLGGMIY